MSLLRHVQSRYPHLASSNLTWSFECDDGWLPILHEFFTSAEAAMAAGGEFSLQQVKEKMGALRIYYRMTDASVEARKAVAEAYRLASARSFHVCEICGRRGHMHTFGGLYKVVCSEHANGELGKGTRVEYDALVHGEEPFDPNTDPFLKSLQA